MVASGVVDEIDPSTSRERPGSFRTPIHEYIVMKVAGGGMISDLCGPFPSKGGECKIIRVGMVVTDNRIILFCLEIELERIGIPAGTSDHVASDGTEVGIW